MDNGVSVVIPLHNEENSILPTFAELSRELENAGLNFEIVYVDVGSHDRSPMITSRLAENHPQVQALSVSSSARSRASFSEALRIGVDQAKHEVVVFAGSNGQLPAFEIPSMVQALNRGQDLVCGARKISWFNRLRHSLSRFMLRRFFAVDLHDLTSPILTTRKTPLRQFLGLRRLDRLLPVYFRLSGFRVSEVDVSTRKVTPTSRREPGWLLPEIWRLRKQMRLQNLKFIEADKNPKSG
ncbi:MAG: glycosyltransferase [Bdellovibrionales bacterium]|nr:glycosyltransferase [Bdellovibrionales bacterium]